MLQTFEHVHQSVVPNLLFVSMDPTAGPLSFFAFSNDSHGCIALAVKVLQRDPFALLFLADSCCHKLAPEPDPVAMPSWSSFIPGRRHPRPVRMPNRPLLELGRVPEISSDSSRAQSAHTGNVDHDYAHLFQEDESVEAEPADPLFSWYQDRDDHRQAQASSAGLSAWECLSCGRHEAEWDDELKEWYCLHCSATEFYDISAPTKQQTDHGTWVYMPHAASPHKADDPDHEQPAGRRSRRRRRGRHGPPDDESHHDDVGEERAESEGTLLLEGRPK